MGSLPLHPALVHLPLGVAAVVPLVLLVLTVALWRGKIAPRAFALAALLQAVVVVGGFGALVAGEADEDRVEATAGERAVERHEDLAQLFLGLAGGVLALTLGATMAPARWARGLAAAGTLGSLTVLGAGFAVGHSGGQLAYGPGGASALSPASSAGNASVTARAPHDD